MKRSFLFISISLFMASCIVPGSPNRGPYPPQPPLYNPPITPPTNNINPTITHLPSSSPTTERVQAFPYDLAMDTLGHMNCPGDSNPSDDIFFSFKMGSYSKGLKLSPKFIEKTKKFTVAQKEVALRKSPFYNSRAQLALSQRGGPDRHLTLGGKSTVQSLYSFGHPHISSLLAEHNVAYALNNDAKIELQVPIAGANVFQVASLLTGSHILTLTYNNGRDTKSLSLGQGLFYGKSYTVDFSGGPNNKDYLTDVREESLITKKITGSWDCSSNMQFAIFRHDQLTLNIYKENIALFQQKNAGPEDACETKGRVLSRGKQQIFDALFPSQTFLVGRAKKTGELCIKPVDSRNSCYAGQKIARVEFDKSKECSTYDPFNACPSYLSICTRRR